MAITDRLGATVAATDAPSSSTPNAGLAIKTPVRAVSTGTNIVLSGLQTIDSVALVAGDRVLVIGQTDQTTNGIYNVSTGHWAASSDFQNNTQFARGSLVYVTDGSLNAHTLWQLTSSQPIVLGTTLMTFIPFPVGADGLFSNTYRGITAADTLLNSDKGKTIGMSGGFYTCTAGPTSNYDSTFAAVLSNEDTTRLKTILLGNTAYNLWPLHTATIRIQNNVWQIDYDSQWHLTSDLTVCVATTGLDTNDGLSSAGNGPFLTIAKAAAFIQSYIDACNHNVNISVADGIYAAGCSVAGAMKGAVQFFITGNIANPANCVIDLPTMGICFETADLAIMTVRGFKLKGAAGSVGFHAWKQGGLDYGNIDFNDMGPFGIHIACDIGAVIICVGDYEITAGAYYHFIAGSQAYLKPSGYNVTIAVSLAFNTFTSASTGANIQGPPTFIGAGVAGTTGVRANASDNGVIYVNGNASAFPGNSANVASTGGIVR